MAGDRGWYVGVGLGDVTANYKVPDFDDGSISEGLADNSDSIWTVFGGYGINRYLAMEVGYADLHNDVDGKTTFSGLSDGTGSRFDSLPGGVVSVDIHGINAFFIAAIGSLPLTARLAVTAKVGATIWDAWQTTVDLGRRDATLNGIDTLAGIGLEYRFDSGIAIRGEAQRYVNLGAADKKLALLSLMFRF